MRGKGAAPPLKGQVQPEAGPHQGSSGLDVARLFAFRAILDVERYPLALGQLAEAAGLNFGKMREEVFAATIGRDEAEPLGIIEPFDDACSHVLKLRKKY